MKVRDVAIGLIVVVAIVAAVLVVKKAKTQKTPFVPSPTSSAQGEITNMFKYEIPDGTPKAELKSVSTVEGFGIATKEAVLADIPDLKSGEFYQVWTGEGEVLESLGKMRPAKGGYIYEGNISGQKVVVSLEKVFDNKIETKILEGSF